MRRCPECGFRADDTICPLCGVKMRPEPAADAAIQTQTHTHTETGEHCGVEQKKAAPRPEQYRPEHQNGSRQQAGRQKASANGQKPILLWVVLVIVFYVLLNACSAYL